MHLPLSIVVLHYNRWDLTKDCLASIDAQDIPCSHEKVLVDNGSDHAVNWQVNGWRVVRYETNKHQIQGQNRCFESAQGEWVLFVANDVRFQSSCIRELWTCASQTFPDTSQIQPALFQPNGKIDQTGMTWRWPGYGMSRKCNQTGAVQIIPSTCYLMRKAVWEHTGGFDEQLLTSHEDVDMGLRVSGTKIVCTNAHAIHLVNATLKYSPSHNRHAFHQDRVYIIKKHYHGLDRMLRLATVSFLD